MPKQKTHKGLLKRVRVTGRGKVKRRKSYSGHLMSGRSPKRLRSVRHALTMTKADTKRTREAIGQ